jgi:hypothetical protein
MQRRQFAAATGSAVVIGLAGCLGGGDSADTSSPGAVVESYYETAYDLDSDASGEDIVEELDGHLHSESPYRELFEESPNESGTGGTERSLDSVETEVTEEDVGEEALRQEYASFFEISDSVISSLAEENAVVSATLTFEDAEDQEAEHLTATEDGDWQVFI